MAGDEREQLAAALKHAIAARLPETAVRESATSAAGVEIATLVATTRESSISFTAPLLRAVMDGSKTQTRRPVRPAPAAVADGVPRLADGSEIAPLARVGDVLCVRESWARLERGYAYAIDKVARDVRWNSSRFMPREAARLFLPRHIGRGRSIVIDR